MANIIMNILKSASDENLLTSEILPNMVAIKGLFVFVY